MEHVTSRVAFAEVDGAVDQVKVVRRRLRLGALLAVVYAVSVLTVASRAGSPGFAAIAK